MERTVRSLKPEHMLIATFLGAIVVANLAVAHFGQPALVVTAFVLIPFDLVARDVLHERWKADERGVFYRMLGLVLAGAVLTVALNWGAAQIAVASVLAFTFATATNAIMFEKLQVARLTRMNISNLGAAIVDSIAFPVVAFGLANVSWTLSASQAGSKFVGGLVFSSIFVYMSKR